MKNLRIVIVAILLFALLAEVGSAVPLVPQNIGLRDSSFADISDSICRNCHADIPDTHHSMVGSGSTPLGCMSCHPWDPVAQAMVKETDCKACHKMDTAWDVNPVVNLTELRPGTRGRPHHNITKNSTWNTGAQAAYWAADRQCNNCHDTGLVASYDDGHYVPSYAPSMVTPFSTFKINATIGGGQEWGGCYACHDEDATASPVIGNPDDTHHGARFYVGYQCNNCHVSNAFRAEPVPDYNPEPNANYYRIDVFTADLYKTYATMFQWDNKTKIELRNSTLSTVNGTGCEKCHSVATLHNIEFDAANSIANEIPMLGHIGNQSDCDGCHAGWDASAVGNPFDAEKAITLNSVTPNILTAGTATSVTLAGDNLVEDAYTTSVLVDGVPVTQTSATSSQIVVTVPGDLAAGGHSVKVTKGSIASSLSMLSVVDPGTITSAKLTDGVLTIEGTGLGAGQQGVAITKVDGRDVLSDSITSSTDTEIVAVSTLAAVGDTVKVMTPTGAATATIAEGVVPTPTPTPTPVVDSVTVTAPNGGESFKKGTTITITWDRAGASQASNVKIEILKGTSVAAKISSTPNDGTQTLKLPTSTGNNYKVRITSLSHTPSYTDSSDGTFSIVR